MLLTGPCYNMVLEKACGQLPPDGRIAALLAAC